MTEKSFVLRKRIAQRYGTVEHRLAGCVVAAIGNEVAETFELERLLGLDLAQARFEPGAHDAARSRIEMVAVGLAVAIVVWIGGGEQALVQTHIGFDRVPRTDPMDRAFDLALGARLARSRGWIERTQQCGYISIRILFHLFALYDTDPAQAHFGARREAEESFRRRFHEILALDPKFARERDRARAERLVLRMIGKPQRLGVVVGQVGNDQFQWIDHREAARRARVELFAHAAFEHRIFDHRILLGDARALPDRADRCGWKAAPARARQRRHARIVPAVDELIF